MICLRSDAQLIGRASRGYRLDIIYDDIAFSQHQKQFTR